jgi:hypothetical protein
MADAADAKDVCEFDYWLNWFDCFFFFRSIFNRKLKRVCIFLFILFYSLFLVHFLLWIYLSVLWSIISINKNEKYSSKFSIEFSQNIFFFLVRKWWFNRNVHDWWSKEVLQCHEENGKQKTNESFTKTTSKYRQSPVDSA